MSLADRISAYNRRRKWDLFLREIAPTSRTRVLDVGFVESEYFATDNFIEKQYRYPRMLVALGIDPPVHFRKNYPAVEVVQYDGGVFPFRDQSFDVCWSNAVIEHVGDRERQVAFVEEIRRVSRIAFISTPNRYFPFEVHTRTLFLHYLPKSLFDNYLNIVGNKWAAGDYMNLLSLRSVQDILYRANISEYKIIKNRFIGFTLDFVVIFKSC